MGFRSESARGRNQDTGDGSDFNVKLHGRGWGSVATAEQSGALEECECGSHQREGLIAHDRCEHAPVVRVPRLSLRESAYPAGRPSAWEASAITRVARFPASSCRTRQRAFPNFPKVNSPSPGSTAQFQLSAGVEPGTTRAPPKTTTYLYPRERSDLGPCMSPLSSPTEPPAARGQRR